MIQYPPVDKLVDIMGCKYALACIISKRARQIMDQPTLFTPTTNLKAISQAAQEVYENRLTYIKG
ncbi:MAG: DNA-directed RNA polymerase subunit omega [Firmicutes bacterium]|nr:DNA-directed RNA polymerase subunit omega [Bacillota bacterium]